MFRKACGRQAAAGGLWMPPRTKTFACCWPRLATGATCSSLQIAGSDPQSDTTGGVEQTFDSLTTVIGHYSAKPVSITN